MDNLLQPYSRNAQLLKLGIYKHYKGNCYKILHVGRHTETVEEVVIYQGLYGSYDIWVRTLTMFIEDIEYNGVIQPRFTFLQENLIGEYL